MTVEAESERILVVDDDESLCRSLQLILEKRGYDSETALSGEEAIRKAGEKSYHMALLDIRLPDMQGLELLTRLSEIQSDMDMILITGHASVETALAAVKSKAAAYIIKPIDMRELFNTIEKVLEKQHLIHERNFAEDALRRSEERFRSIFKESPISMDVFDANGDFMQANEACLEMYGLSDEEALRGFNLFSDPNLHDNLKTKLHNGETIRTDVPFDFDEVKKLGLYETSKSGLRYHEAVISPLGLDESGKPMGFVAQTKDITERKKVEESLRESEERYRNLFQNAQVGLFRTRISDGKVVACNKTGARILGYTSPAEAIAKFVASEHYVDPDVRHQMLNLLAKDGKFSNFQAQITKRDGTIIWVEFSATLYAEEGYLESVVIDITERKMAEEELSRSESKYRNLVEESLQGVAVIQKNRYIYVNPAFARTVGYTIEEMLEFTPEEVWTCYHPDDREEQRRRHKALEVGLKFLPRQRFHYVRRDGSIRWVDSFTRITEQYGDPAMQVVEIDITEQKRAEESLQAAADTAMFYLDLMGHDIRNHLQAIVMGADILSHHDTDPGFTSTLDLIVESVHNSQTLINKIHATRGILSTPLTELSLKEILEDGVNTLKETFDDFHIDVECRVGHALVRADKYLPHLLLNLLENGVLHNTRKVRKVWVVLSDVEEGYTVSIADNGPGIPDEKKETLFDPNRRFGGVGLHQAMRIVQKYGGRITIHDRVKNDSSQGALLHLWLPKSATST